MYFLLYQRRNNYDEGRMKMNNRARRAASEDSINRTVYVSDIDYQVSYFYKKFAVNFVVG